MKMKGIEGTIFLYSYVCYIVDKTLLYRNSYYNDCCYNLNRHLNKISINYNYYYKDYKYYKLV